MRRIDRRRIRLARALREVLEGVGGTSAALNVGDIDLARRRAQTTFEAGARLAELLTRMEESDYWRSPKNDNLPESVRRQSRRAA